MVDLVAGFARVEIGKGNDMAIRLVLWEVVDGKMYVLDAMEPQPVFEDECRAVMANAVAEYSAGGRTVRLTEYEIDKAQP